MTRTLTVAGTYAGRVPSPQQAALRRPLLRLVRSEADAPFPPARQPVPPPRTRPASTVPATFDEEDAERWDGMA
jgi:hypothetical protein